MSWSDIKQRFPGKHSLICLHSFVLTTKVRTLPMMNEKGYV